MLSGESDVSSEQCGSTVRNGLPLFSKASGSIAARSSGLQNIHAHQTRIKQCKSGCAVLKNTTGDFGARHLCQNIEVDGCCLEIGCGLDQPAH